MNGVLCKAKEMGQTMAIRAAKSVDTPIRNHLDSSRQFMFLILGRANGDGRNDVGFLPQVVDVPMEFFTLTAVTSQSGR